MKKRRLELNDEDAIKAVKEAILNADPCNRFTVMEYARKVSDP